MENNTVRATDRAREALAEFPRQPGAMHLEDDIIPAALDFADAVEAALAKDGPPIIRALYIDKALTAFLAQLDRATGGDSCDEHDTESLRSENARLRALLDERTALLRECLSNVYEIKDYHRTVAAQIRAALETTCDS